MKGNLLQPDWLNPSFVRTTVLQNSSQKNKTLADCIFLQSAQVGFEPKTPRLQSMLANQSANGIIPFAK